MTHCVNELKRHMSLSCFIERKIACGCCACWNLVIELRKKGNLKRMVVRFQMLSGLIGSLPNKGIVFDVELQCRDFVKINQLPCTWPEPCCCTRGKSCVITLSSIQQKNSSSQYIFSDLNVCNHVCMYIWVVLGDLDVM